MFFAGVWRVLKPGGRFCYTDVFGDLAEPARMRRRLESSGLVIESEDDITDRVARGLAAGYADFERLLGNMTSEQRGNADLVASMLRSIKRIPDEAYASGKAVYVAWRARKPDPMPGSSGRDADGRDGAGDTP